MSYNINVISSLAAREMESDRMKPMYTVHATKKLLDRIKLPVEAPCDAPSTILGNWYAKPLFWKPQYVLFVNEKTYLPVLAPLAPAATLLSRFPEVLATTLEAHRISRSFIDSEISAMQSVGLSKTQSRQPKRQRHDPFIPTYERRIQ